MENVNYNSYSKLKYMYKKLSGSEFSVSTHSYQRMDLFLKLDFGIRNNLLGFNSFKINKQNISGVGLASIIKL